MKKKKLLIILSVLLIAMLAVMAACADTGEEIDPGVDDKPPAGTLTPNQALDRIYDGLLSGGEAMNEMSGYGVENVYTLFTSILNYTVTYKANYNANYADSEIYVGIFDNQAYTERLTLYYDGSDLYMRSGADGFVVSDFGGTMMFNVFYEACRGLDLSAKFFSDDVGTIFNRNNTGVNLGLLLDQRNVSYNLAGENSDVIELSDLDLSIINETVTVAMDTYFRDIGNKFDLITKKFLNFNLSRLLESRFAYIYADGIQVRMTDKVATDTLWKISGSLQDSSKYWMEASVGYNDGQSKLEESAGFVKSKFTEASLGKNHFTGTMFIPAVSDEAFDAELITNINSVDNSLNESALSITDASGTNFLSAYYRGEHAFVDATGFCDWMGGAIDLDVFNLPKVYFDNIDLTKLINAGYNNLIKAMLVLIERGVEGEGGETSDDLYSAIMENFGNDGKSLVYYIFTEELYHKISGDDTPLMTRAAELLGIEETKLASYIGEDFFTAAELIVAYDLETKEIIITMNHREEMLFRLNLFRDEFEGITFPPDANTESSAYSKLVIPEVVTMEIEATLAVRNGKAETDLSRFWGVAIGDPTGINTADRLSNTEVLILKGTISERYRLDASGQTVTENSVNLRIYKRAQDGAERLVFAVCNNPDVRSELLIDFYLPMGDLTPPKDGLKYRLDREVLKDGFDELLGEGNIFSENSILSILDTLLNSEGISVVSKIEGWFTFSLVVSGENDPVYDLLGIKDTTASVKARVLFTGTDTEIDTSEYDLPVLTELDNILINSLYDNGSAWKDSVEVIINSSVFHLKPTYSEESVEIVTGTARYTPSAFLFGQEVTYEVQISDVTGTYRIERLDLEDNILIIDPAFTSKLPSSLSVVFDNGERGRLDCVIEGFDERNITNSGYNLKGFVGELDDGMKSRVVIGVNSIMNVTFEIYVLVHNRKVVPIIDEAGKEMYTDTGVPVVGAVTVDPYTYAMRRLDDSGYNPVISGIEEQKMELRFNGVYGYETVPDGESEIERELSYDIFGYNRFNLTELNLNWEYDLTVIDWMGSSRYAYAVYGGENGDEVKIAVKVTVPVQKVEYVIIDEELSGTYTIDFLIRATYSIPTQSGGGHTVKLYFKSDNAANPRSRTITAVRPEGISDSEYYENYLAIGLDWLGAEGIVENPYIITSEGSKEPLFGKDNITSATFGKSLGLTAQTVSLSVVVPSRYQSASEDTSMGVTIANGCNVVDGEASFVNTQIRISKAHFPGLEFYAPLEINPYDAAARLPSEIYLEVDKTAGSNAERTVKKYPVSWVTTDSNGKELNLIELKEDGGYGLKHPVTEAQEMAVYGKLGDRGGEDEKNPGFIWIVMRIKNLASKLQSITYEGLADGQTVIAVDPYVDYVLPDSFTAVLQSGKIITKLGIEWYVSKINEDEWYPINYIEGYDTRYYKDGRYVFGREGGRYEIRYVIDGGGDIIAQELILEVEVSARTLESSRLDVFDSGAQPAAGYSEINYYQAAGTELYERLKILADGGSAGLCFSEARSDGIFVVYSLAVDWTRADAGQSGYENSLDRLISMLERASAGMSMTLIGTIGTGTVNEQALSVTFSFANLTVESLALDRIAVTSESGAVSVDEMTGRTVDFASLGEEKELNVRFLKPFGLTVPDEDRAERYASPYAYISYLFGALTANFVNGTVAELVPVLDFGAYTEEGFNASVLGLNSQAADTLTVIRLARLSAGPATDEIIVNIHAPKDKRLDSSKDITAELFNEDSTERYADSYALPRYIEVNYELSGAVIYPVSSWKIGQNSLPYFDTQETEGIPVRLLDTLRTSSGENQAATYGFYYSLPCVGEDFYISVYIPKKNIQGDRYSAQGETSLYDIRSGVLNIDNAYLYYDAESEYGLDISKIPSVIRAELTSEYIATDVNTHYVGWEFRKGVFNAELIRKGAEKLLFATAALPAYFAASGRRQTQRVNLYITVKALAFSGISYGELPVKIGADGLDNVIEIDPYNDVMGYRGTMVLPTAGLTVLFNGGADRYVFEAVTYKLRSVTGAAFENNITTIPYDEKGHSLTYENLREDGVLELNMYIPGYETDGILVYVNILSRIIEEVDVPNNAYAADGSVVVMSLPSLYYIDPYNNATFPLPDTVSVKFKESDSFAEQTVAGWEIYNEAVGAWTSLDASSDFYSRAADHDNSIGYGYYKSTANSYKGGVFTLRGYISLGRTSTGVAGRQNFTVTIIVLNRSLKTNYSTSYRFDDPMGGVLSDIPGALNEEMFVDYDKYYAELGLPEALRYSSFSIPALPEVNWAVRNENSVIDYKGGFDLDLTGNVYYANRNKAELYAAFSAETGARYAELVKARMWDAYFTAGGTPQAYYSARTTQNLNALAAKLENEVVNATYTIIVNRFNTSADESEKQYGNYMSNGLINEITADTGLDAATQMNEIVAEMFALLKEQYDADAAAGGEPSVKGAIYSAWKKLYDEYKSAGADTDPSLGDYRKLKAAKYDEAEATSCFTSYERDNYNKKHREQIERSLSSYVNASVWDMLYDRSLGVERERMDDLKRGDTVTAKSNALIAYMGDSVARLGSIGENAYVRVTAPKFEIGNILDADGNVLTEFAFNVYSAVAFLAEVDVETVLNYSSVFERYIQEGVRMALDDFRSSSKEYSLTEYVVLKTAEYVNGIVPLVEQPGTGEQTKPLIDFTYAKFNENDERNADHWTKLYDDAESRATEAIDRLTGTPEEKWNLAREAHRIAGEDDMLAVMDDIWQSVTSDATVVDKYGDAFSNVDKYGDAFSKYGEYIKDLATSEMDGFYDEAVKDADVTMTDAIVIGKSGLFSDLAARYGGYGMLFSFMYGATASDAYDTLLKSYKQGTEEYTAVSNALLTANSVKGAALYNLMYSSGGIIIELESRARYIFQWKLGGEAAYDALYADSAKIGFTTDELDGLIASAAIGDGVIKESDYNGAFTEEEFRSFGKSVIFDNIHVYYRGNAERNALLTAWLNAAVRDAKAEAYENLYRYLIASAELADANTVLSIRADNCAIERNAFNKYVKHYAGKGAALQTGFNAEYAEIYSKAEFDASGRIVETLLSDDTFAYKGYLTPSDDEAAAFKSEAVGLYYERYASAKEKIAIDFHLSAAGGTQAYEELLRREDLGEEFRRGMGNAYYRVILDKMLIRIKAGISVDTSDAEYTKLFNDYSALFNAVSARKQLAQEQTGYRDSAVAAAYVEKVYAGAISAYTAIINKIPATVKESASAAVYDALYDVDGAALDVVLKEYYDSVASDPLTEALARLNYNAYGYLRQLIIDDELAHYRAAAETVTSEEAKAKLYDSLGEYSLTDAGAEDFARKLFEAWKAVYDGIYSRVTDEERAAIDAVADKSAFVKGDGESFLDKLLQIETVYLNVITVNAGDAQPIIDELAAGWEGAVSSARSGFAAAVKTSVGQNLVREGNFVARALNVRTAVTEAKLLSKLDGARRGIDPELMSTANLQGDFSKTGNKFKAAYTDILGAVCAELKLTAAADYIAVRLERETIDWYNLPETDDRYAELESLILAELRLTSEHNVLEEYDLPDNPVTVKRYVQNKTTVIDSQLLAKYLAAAGGQTDAEYAKVFAAMRADEKTTIAFNTEDNLSDGNIDGTRRMLVFDKSGLTAGTESFALAPVYLANGSKIGPDYSNAHKIDGIIYRYVQLRIVYVDYTGESTAETIESYVGRNSLTVDPLAPILPDKVQAYGEYTPADSATAVLYDVGMVDVEYNDTFYENIYDGLESEVLSYSIYLKDSRGNANELVLAVDYLDRTVDRIYLENRFYGGSVVTGDAEYNGYYDVYDETSRTNRMVINPINADILDTVNGAYMMPETLVVNFRDGSRSLYRDAVWDMSAVSYSLSGQANVDMRLLSYTVASDDGERRVRFDYGSPGSVTMSLYDADGNELSSEMFSNAPSYAVWNVKLDITDQTVTKLSYFNRETGEITLLGEGAQTGGFIDVPIGAYSVNPFDIVYPDTCVVSFRDGSEEILDMTTWRLEPGSEGVYKIKDIIIGQAGDNLVMANFVYLGYTVRVRFVADNIELEGLDENEYIDGGTLYLVRNGGSVYVQMAENYSYFYYNFSSVASAPDYRKVPLSFINTDISEISTNSVRVYRGVKGVLGWDKVNYPDMNMSANILFDVAIIDPIMSAQYDGEVNPYVSVDYISTPYDSNFQKKKDSQEPEGAEYFVQLGEEENRYFLINKDTVVYDIINRTVFYECEFSLTGTNGRLAADGAGGRTMNFTVAVPLECYLYTEVEEAYFDRTPVKDGLGNDIWSWTTVDEDSADYRDAIYWPLGRSMKASELPGAFTAAGERIKLFWDLDGVNVNRATDRGYAVTGYYYDKDSVWNGMSLLIYIDKRDVSENITEALGGNMALERIYDGNYYKLPLDLSAAVMRVLREDGSYAALGDGAVTVEYKRFDEDDREYSETAYPLNAGTYAIRVRVEDYNAEINGELVFRLTISPYTIYGTWITFENENNNTVVYTYDGKEKNLIVTGGLPSVRVDNWFASREEKDALVNAQTALGYDETTAKSRAYNELYRGVTAPTKSYMDALRASVREETGLEGEELNATVFDRLDYGLEICEVVYRISYTSGDTALAGAPVGVSSYAAKFEILPGDNNGNYVFNVASVSRFMEILTPDVEYSVANTELTYTGRLQNPYINGLHDAEGRLPAGVTVTYSYHTGSGASAQYFAGGVTDVGVYLCEITIDGGDNYPDGEFAPFTVTVRPQNLYIDIGKTGSMYLSEIADVSGVIGFNGLVGSDRPSSFGYADVFTEAQSYYTLGVYGIFFNGFKVDASFASHYTQTDGTVEIEGREYYRLRLKGAGIDGSLYAYTNDDGSYAYADLIAKFTNYTVYVLIGGEYEIYAEDGAVVVNGDEELQQALAAVSEGDSAKIYLGANLDGDGNPTPYSAVTVDVNAEISLIGCYDENHNILTSIDSVIVKRGAVNIRILSFNVTETGGVSLVVEDGANSVNVYDSEFNGGDFQYAVGIRVSENYAFKLFVSNSSFADYRRGIELKGGNMELDACSFVNNEFGVHIISGGSDIRIARSEFVGQTTAVYTENIAVNILYNEFGYNRTAIRAPGADEATLLSRNTFSDTNTVAVDVAE